MEIVMLIIEFSLIFWAINYVIKSKITIKSILMFIGTIILPTMLLFLLIGQWAGISYLLISVFVYSYLVSKQWMSIVHICFVLIVGVLSDSLTQLITELRFINTYSSLILHYVIFTFMFIFGVFMYRLLSQKLYEMWGRWKTVYLFVFFVALMTLGTIYANLYITDNFSQDDLLKFNIITQVIYFAMMIFLLFFTLTNLKKEARFREIENETAQFNHYMQSLEIINQDMQKFRHDYSNILATLQGYLEINDYEGLRTYFKEHILTAEEETFLRNKRLANVSKLEVVGIKGLLLTKSLQGEQEGITFNIDISDVIDDIDMNVIDLSRILGIFIDNAIEANQDPLIEDDKEINISIFKGMSNSTIIIVENTLHSSSKMYEQVGVDGFTTKGKGRGKGLSIVRGIVNQYPNVYLNTSVDENLFTQFIEIARNEKFHEQSQVS